MEHETDKQWEELLDRKLRDLPEREAPATLIPRVLAAIEARARLPWWRRSWWHWPPLARILALVLLGVVVGGMAYLLAGVEHSLVVAAVEQQAVDWLARLTPFWNACVTLGNAAALVLRQCGNLLLFGAVFLCVGMYLSCLALGTVCYRLALNR